MIKLLPIILFLFLIPATVSAQLSPYELDCLYRDIAISKNNNLSASELAQYLANIESVVASPTLSVEDHLKAYLILANLHKFQGNAILALEFAQRGQDFAASQKEYLWQARLLGFMATQYREINMLELSNEKLAKATKVSEKVPDSDELFRFKHNVYHEMAYQSEANDRINQALQYIRQSSQWAKKIKNERGLFSLAVNYQYTGILFNKLNQPDSAAFYFNQSLQIIDNQEININTQTLKNYIYADLGKSYLAKKDFASSKEFFTKVLNDSLKYRPLELNEELYNNLTDYYQKTSNLDSLSLYRAKLDSISKLINQNKNKAVNTVTKTLNSNSQSFKKYKSYYWYSVAASLIVISAIGFILKRHWKSQDVLKALRITEKDETKTDFSMAKDTEQRLQELFKSFGDEKQFLDPNISVPLLANQFNTNTKYITFILKQMYDKDFATYINELRINYIADLLKKDSEYRQYKISYLAAITGFSSHSKFTAMFKKVKGISPSQFVNELEEKERKP